MQGAWGCSSGASLSAPHYRDSPLWLSTPLLGAITLGGQQQGKVHGLAKINTNMSLSLVPCPLSHPLALLEAEDPSAGKCLRWDGRSSHPKHPRWDGLAITPSACEGQSWGCNEGTVHGEWNELVLDQMI